MAGDVNRRPYSSERRREQAEQTRARVLAAAAALFVERGYEGASVAAIAERAGVSDETVYARFRTKRALLGEVVRRTVRGDDPRPIPEQEGPRAVAAASDQREQIRLFAADIAPRLERVAPVVDVVGAASRSEPELGELFAQLHADRLRNLGGFVEALARNGPLRLSAGEAAQTVWALTSPELHQALTRVQGWNRPRYSAWLADSLEALLLPGG